ncbi:MAG: hypothetical protein ACKOT0_01915 [bacterium]
MLQRPTRAVSILSALAVGVGLAGPAKPAAVAARAPAPAADPTSVSFTLEGCRTDGTIALPDAGGNYVCPDAAYTSGNLGKGWA